ncbi:MAG: dihydropteroate synthase [Alistipes sp.]|nr:dihydropteroate synthase [Alistipes sp.]
MAIVNVTNDSFYGASRNYSGEDVEKRVRQALEDGVSLFDVGGCSSRPNAVHISLEDEWRRVELGLRSVRQVAADAMLSVDTFRSEIVQRAVENFGDIIVNDISAGEQDDAMIDVVAKYNLPYIAMHMRGTPQTMQSLTSYEKDITSEVCDYFAAKCQALRDRGVNKIILDPGFGFAKTLEQNYELLAGLHRLRAMGYPVLAGLSRKSMIYRVLDTIPENSLAGTTALNWEALRQGATILRVHDTREACDIIKLFKKYTSLL